MLATDFLNIFLASFSTHVSFLMQSKNKMFFFKKKWANPGLFFVYFRPLSNKHYYNFYNRSTGKNVMSIQCMAPGFEPTTFGS